MISSYLPRSSDLVANFQRRSALLGRPGDPFSFDHPTEDRPFNFAGMDFGSSLIAKRQVSNLPTDFSPGGGQYPARREAPTIPSLRGNPQSPGFDVRSGIDAGRAITNFLPESTLPATAPLTTSEIFRSGLLDPFGASSNFLIGPSTGTIAGSTAGSQVGAQVAAQAGAQAAGEIGAQAGTQAASQGAEAAASGFGWGAAGATFGASKVIEFLVRGIITGDWGSAFKQTVSFGFWE